MVGLGPVKISESELSAVGRTYILGILRSELSESECIGVERIKSQSQNCLLSADLILTILESEMSAVGSSYKHIGLLSQGIIESEWCYKYRHRPTIPEFWLLESELLVVGLNGRFILYQSLNCRLVLQIWTYYPRQYAGVGIVGCRP